MFFFNPSFLSSHINGRGYFLTFMFYRLQPGNGRGPRPSLSACQLADAEPRAAASFARSASWLRSLVPPCCRSIPRPFADLGSEIGSAASALLPTFHPREGLEGRGTGCRCCGGSGGRCCMSCEGGGWLFHRRTLEHLLSPSSSPSPLHLLLFLSESSGLSSRSSHALHAGRLSANHSTELSNIYHVLR